MRNANGTGAIVKLSGNRRKKYAVRVTTGWENGKQQRKYLGYYSTEPEAIIALAEYHKGGFNVDLNNLTLDEMYERWISRIESKVSKNVLNTHNMSRMRFGRLGKLPFIKIKADHLQDWMDNIELKPGSKKRMKSTMIQLWKYAIKNDVVHTNYAEMIDVQGEIESTGILFTDEQIKWLWDNTNDPTVRWILILIYTGMRIGELLKITSQTIFLDKQYMIGGSKSEAGRDRVIPIHDAILPLVKQQLSESNCLVYGEKGRALMYNGALRKFDALMLKQNWKHKPHDTRKTAVSLMHDADIPIETIRIIVGHSAQGVTESVYLRKTPEALVKEVNKIKIDFQ